jgi:hypothetical protein
MHVYVCVTEQRWEVMHIYGCVHETEGHVMHVYAYVHETEVLETERGMRRDPFRGYGMYIFMQ